MSCKSNTNYLVVNCCRKIAKGVARNAEVAATERKLSPKRSRNCRQRVEVVAKEQKLPPKGQALSQSAEVVAREANLSPNSLDCLPLEPAAAHTPGPLICILRKQRQGKSCFLVQPGLRSMRRNIVRRVMKAMCLRNK